MWRLTGGVPPRHAFIQQLLIWPVFKDSTSMSALSHRPVESLPVNKIASPPGRTWGQRWLPPCSTRWDRFLTVLNSIMEITRAGGSLGIPGLYVTGDPGGVDAAAKIGSLSIRIGLGWAKSHSLHTGQTPVMRYHHGLMQMILNDRAQIAKAVNATVISLHEAPQGY